MNHFVKDLGIALEECKQMGLALPGLALVILTIPSCSRMIFKLQSAKMTACVATMCIQLPLSSNSIII